MNPDAHSVPARQALGQGTQPVGAAGRNRQVPAFGGEPAGERFPDSGGRSGHDGKDGYRRPAWPAR
jgi:hypothetical protein